MTERDQRLENLRRANEQKTAAARATVELTVSRMVQKGARVNINSVSRAAGVSRGFIYANEDLRQLISTESAKETAKIRRATPQPNTESLTARLASALDTIRALKAERKILERRIENLTAQLVDSRTRPE